MPFPGAGSLGGGGAALCNIKRFEGGQKMAGRGSVGISCHREQKWRVAPSYL